MLLSRTVKKVLNCFCFFGVLLQEVTGDHRGNESTDDDLESFIATAIFLIVTVGLLGCIWCSCFMMDLYNTINTNKMRENECP